MNSKLAFIKFFSLLVFALFLLASQEVQAQRKKKKSDVTEEKTDKKAKANEKKAKAADDKKTIAEIKALLKNPAEYRKMKEGLANAQSEVTRLNTENVRLKEVQDQCETNKINLEKQLEEYMNKITNLENQPKGGGSVIPGKGMYYVVQIGAFQQKDVEVNPDNPDLRKDVTDGFNKYIMGVFQDISQADQLRMFLLQLDFRRNPAYRPFIAPYKDGKRISLEEALGPEEAQKRKQQMGIK